MASRNNGLLALFALLLSLAILACVFSYLMGKNDGSREASRDHVITCSTIDVVAWENGVRARCGNE